MAVQRIGRWLDGSIITVVCQHYINIMKLDFVLNVTKGIKQMYCLKKNFAMTAN